MQNGECLLADGLAVRRAGPRAGTRIHPHEAAAREEGPDRRRKDATGPPFEEANGDIRRTSRERAARSHYCGNSGEIGKASPLAFLASKAHIGYQAASRLAGNDPPASFCRGTGRYSTPPNMPQNGLVLLHPTGWFSFPPLTQRLDCHPITSAKRNPTAPSTKRL
jgi:hypothetical protein